MKIKREARQAARRIYRSCLVDGQLQPDRILAAVREVIEQRPRGYLSILERLRVLTAFEVNRRTFTVQSTVDLPDQGSSIFANLTKQFGEPLAKHYSVNPSLLGGLRVQVGSEVWDGSVRQRLRLLDPTFN